MSSIAEKAAARRAKILARGKDRMAIVSGGMSASDLPQSSPSPEEAAMDQAKREEELQKALDAIDEQHVAQAVSKQTTASDTTAANTQTTDAPSFSPSPSSSPSVPDPHEFLSSEDAAAFNAEDEANAAEMQQLSSSSAPSPFDLMSGMMGGDGDSAMAFAQFAQAARAHKQAARDSASLAAAELAAPTQLSPLKKWSKHVSNKFVQLQPVRIATVVLVILTAVCAGSGIVEGGIGWIMIIEIMALSLAFIKQQQTKKPKPPSRVSSPAPPTAVPSVDGELELDTDMYRAPPSAAPGATDLASMLSGMQLPPALDTFLKAAQLLMKYAAFMQQLMHDAIIFIFITVLITATCQLAAPEAERIRYTQ